MHTSRWNNGFRIFGRLLLALAFGMVPSFIVSILCSENTQILSFGITILASATTGILILLTVTESDKKLKKRDGFLIISLGWVLASLVGSIPFAASGCLPSYMDCFFESCSGFTTTGASVILDLEEIPLSLLFWRSVTVWLGGMGIILFTAFMLPFSRVSGKSSLGRRESDMGSIERGYLKVTGPVIYLTKVYVTLTAVLILLLFTFTKDFSDSVIHGLSIIGTGGFSSHNDGIAWYSSIAVRSVLIIFMIMVGINFNIYSDIRYKGIRTAFRSTEIRFYLGMILVTSCLIFVDLMRHGGYVSVEKAATDSLFQVSSMISTTGQHTVDYEMWPTFSKMLLFMLMLTGSCSSSIGGGPKLIRILISLKLIRRGMALKLHPNSVRPILIDRTGISQETSTNVVNHMFLYFLIIFTGSLLISFDGNDLMTTFSAAISCINNNGTGFSTICPSGSFAGFSLLSKSVMSVLMIAGRLELFTFFMLFSPHYWHPDRA